MTFTLACFHFSAKVLVRGEPNVSYICSRYYRAPELIFGATDYTCQIGQYKFDKSFNPLNTGTVVLVDYWNPFTDTLLYT